MFELHILDLIPQDLKQQARDALVNFVADQAQKLVGEELSARIKQLRSDADFNKKFEEGLQRAARRFIQEYEAIDEDVVAAIAADRDFFRNEQVRTALLEILKKPGMYLADEQDKIALSFITVLRGRKNRERVDRAVLYLLKCLVEELWYLPELQPVYSLQFQRMTAEATRQQLELQEAQLRAQIELSTSIRDALLQLTDAIAEHRLLAAGDSLALPPVPRVSHNLPQPDYGRFIGREKELAQVYRILRPYPHSQEHLVTIDGIGGIGKSALALEVAHRYLRNYDQVPSEERFEAIIWVSAKQTTLTAEGIKPRQQAFRTLDEIYTTIAVTLKREDIIHVRSEEQSEEVRNALRHQRTLLVIDNLETVDDETVMAFLRELPAPTKAIVTTRHRIDVAHPIRLVGMSPQDAQRLIAQECEKKGVRLNAEDANRLYNRTGGVPLAIVWSVAQIGFGYDVKVVLNRLGQPTSDVARFCFEGTVENIRGRPAHKLLMALSLFAIGADRDALGNVANLPILDRDEGLVQLEKLSLVNKYGQRFSLLPLTKSYATAELEREREWAKEVHEKWLEYLVNKFKNYDVHADFLAGDADIVAVGVESDNALAALDWCIQQDEHQMAIQLADRLSTFLYLSGLIDRSNDTVNIGLNVAKQAGDLHRICDFLTKLGLRYAWKDEYAQAEKRLVEAEALSRQLGNYRLDNVLEYRGATLMRQGAYEAAKPFLEQSLAIREKSDDKRLAVLGRWLLGVLAFRQGDYSVAQSHILQALAQAEAIGYVRGIGFAKNYLGNIYLAQGRLEEADKALNESLIIAEMVHDVRRIARVKESQSTLAERRGYQGLARVLGTEALGLFRLLGMGKDSKKMQDQLGRLRQTVFLDRDGTLNIDDYVTFRKDQFQLIEGVSQGLSMLKSWGFEFVIATNQNGIARASYTEDEMWQFNDLLIQRLRGIDIKREDFYFCPHDPTREQCDCSKPKPGMLFDAARDRSINLRQAYLIGDKMSDILAGRRAGCKKTILVKTGILDDSNKYDVMPDFVVNDLIEAAHKIAETEGLKTSDTSSGKVKGEPPKF